jgi:hypothetical protein
VLLERVDFGDDSEELLIRVEGKIGVVDTLAGQKVVYEVMVSVVREPRGQPVTVGGHDVMVEVLVVRKVEVKVEADVLRFDPVVVVEDRVPLVDVEVYPGHPAWLVLS